MKTQLINALVLSGLTAHLCLLAGCTPTKEDIAELRNDQRQILAKLADLEKKLDQIVARPAAPPPQGATGPDPNKAYALPVAHSPVKGPADAPVTIVEFSDYQCPFCAQLDPVLTDVLKQYPTQAKLVFKHYPLPMHSAALPAAKAAVAAQKQGKFWEMHALLFANFRQLQPEKIKELAQQLGLDMAKFEADMNSPEAQNAIQEDQKLATSVQLRGTPTIFVNGKLIQDRSIDGFKKTIDEVLKAKAAG